MRSARYAGPAATDAENLARLRAEVPAGSGLRYVCAIAHVDPGGSEQVFEGVCDGTMAPAPRGARGFGYDPVFLPADDHDGRTMAELEDAEKDRDLAPRCRRPGAARGARYLRLMAAESAIASSTPA